ncbi:MAG: hypothetical protein ACJ8H8_15115 [Geminicoccaceae bacterium]
MASPAHTLHDGPLKVTIWRNTNRDKGTTWYSVNITRGYRQEETWKDTDSLGQDDILATMELLREAYAWIKMQRRSEAKARREKEKQEQAAYA